MPDIVDGLDEFAAAVRRIEAQLSGANLATAIAPGAELLAAQCRTLAPVLTGGLVSAIGVVTESSRHSATASAQVADSGPGGRQHEAVFLEYGTSRMAPEPFMRPAFDLAAPAALAAAVDNIKDLLK